MSFLATKLIHNLSCYYGPNPENDVENKDPDRSLTGTMLTKKIVCIYLSLKYPKPYWKNRKTNHTVLPKLILTPLIDHLESYLLLEDQEKQLLAQRVTQRKIRRRQYILQDGFPCKHYTFVVEGCLKMFAVDQKGTEHNIQFAAENEWIADIGSMHSGKNSRLFIEAVEPSAIVQIEREDLYFLYLNIPKLDRIFKVIIENKFVELQNRVLQNFSSTAQERYLTFLEQYPTLASRLPNTQIASYLGITPEFLSKIRKEIATKGFSH